MAFAVVCKSCQARFLLNDDLLKRRVAGRVVTVRCRQCHATIEIDASQVDAPAAAAPARREPSGAAVAQPVAPRPMALKATPAPPRPTKSSTLIGIGGPPRPTGSTELVALSPGLLNMDKRAQAPASDFPEPPPPPSLTALEELDADDWEIAETPPVPRADAAPESVDDFVEELPPSIPPAAADEEPTALIPIKQLFVSKDKSDVDFAGPSGGAPTIDVSQLRAEPSSRSSQSVDLGPRDVPLRDSKQTLPLFGLEDSHTESFPSSPKAPPKPRPPQPALSPAEGSLSPASLDPPSSTDRPDSVRTRKNVVAPTTPSSPRAAGERRRSGLAIPILCGLAVAAGVLIWKRGVVSAPDDVSAQSERGVPAAETPAPLATVNPPSVSEPVGVAAPLASSEELSFESLPPQTGPKLGAVAAREPRASAPSEAKPEPTATPTPKSDPPAPRGEAETTVGKVEPKPREPEPPTPSGPAGDFDPAAATAALTASASQASSCRKDGDPSGTASVVITFAPSGRVTSANISGPPFAGTATGGCIAAALRKARVPAFEGDRVTVSKTIVIQ